MDFSGQEWKQERLVGGVAGLQGSISVSWSGMVTGKIIGGTGPRVGQGFSVSALLTMGAG